MYSFFDESKRNFTDIEETASTNTLLKELIRSVNGRCFSVIRARRQSGGRGRLGRSFFSPGGGLYFSAAFPLCGKETHIPFLTLLCGLAASEAIQELGGLETEIKWPNDIMIGEKKLGGILCELVSGKEPTAVAGIGLNLNLCDSETPPELCGKVCSVLGAGAAVPDEVRLMKNILKRLDKAVYTDAELFSPRPETLKKIKERSCSLGKAVSFQENGETLRGIIMDIAPNGAAVVTGEDGKMRELNSAYSVTQLTASHRQP